MLGNLVRRNKRIFEDVEGNASELWEEVKFGLQYGCMRDSFLK